MIENQTAPDHTRRDLAARLAEAEADQAAALALWDRVIFGELVSCEDAIPVPEPVTLSDHDLSAHPDAGPIQAALNQAIQALHNTADLWNIECNDERAYVPLDMAREGRAAALAASDPLADAAARLAAWPE